MLSPGNMLTVMTACPNHISCQALRIMIPKVGIQTLQKDTSSKYINILRECSSSHNANETNTNIQILKKTFKKNYI